MTVDPLAALGLDDSTGAIVFVRTDSPDGLPSIAWVAKGWERLGMLIDALGQEP